MLNQFWKCLEFAFPRLCVVDTCTLSCIYSCMRIRWFFFIVYNIEAMIQSICASNRVLGNFSSVVFFFSLSLPLYTFTLPLIQYRIALLPVEYRKNRSIEANLENEKKIELRNDGYFVHIHAFIHIYM